MNCCFGNALDMYIEWKGSVDSSVVELNEDERGRSVVVQSLVTSEQVTKKEPYWSVWDEQGDSHFLNRCSDGISTSEDDRQIGTDNV